MRVNSKKIVISQEELKEIEDGIDGEVKWKEIGWNLEYLVASDMWIEKDGEKVIDFRERFKIDYTGLNKLERVLFKLIVSILGGYIISSEEVIGVINEERRD